MPKEVKVDLYKEDGLTLEWEEKQRALIRLRQGAPVHVSPKTKVGSRAVCMSADIPDPDLDGGDNQSYASEEFTETEAEDEPTWEEWEKQNTGKLTILKKEKPDDRAVPKEVDERIRKFQESMAEFANQDWLKKNSANNFGEEPKEEKPKPTKKKTTKKETAGKKKGKTEKKKGKSDTTKKTKKKVTKAKPPSKDSDSSSSSSDDDEPKKKTLPSPYKEKAAADPAKPSPAPANDEIDLEAIKNIALESKTEADNKATGAVDGEVSLSEIMHEPERPKYGSKSKISEGSFSSSMNGSQNFKVKTIPLRADHESAFDLTWEEKQAAILMRREQCKPAVKFVPPSRKETTNDDDEAGEASGEIHFDDDRKKVWAQDSKKDKEKVLEDHDSGFSLTWDEKQQVIADKRLGADE